MSVFTIHCNFTGKSCVAFTLIFFATIAPTMLNAKRSYWENRCRLTLRSLGSAQLVYQDLSYNDNYGTWEELIEADYIPQGYTRANIIDHYTLAVFSVKESTLDENGKSNLNSTFTLVAIPRSQKNRLRTFALGDDQTPRVWVGITEEWTTENVSLHNLDLWEPLR